MTKTGIKISELKTSKEWCEHFDIKLGENILDPDGWDRMNFKYSFEEEKINIEEFKNRICRSTITIDDTFDKVMSAAIIND